VHLKLGLAELLRERERPAQAPLASDVPALTICSEIPSAAYNTISCRLPSSPAFPPRPNITLLAYEAALTRLR
jgi:hypothetical protein